MTNGKSAGPAELQTAELRALRSPSAGPMAPEWFVVEEVSQDNADTFTLDIRAENVGAFSFAPGQFNMLYAPGVGEVPISISGDPGDPVRLRHTIRSVGAVSAALCASRPGARVGVRGPFGSEWPLQAAKGRDLIIVAGGIGLAPLRPAILGALAMGDAVDSLTLLYGARTPPDMLYPEQIEEWGSGGRMTVDVTVDSAAGEWHGNVGVVPSLIPRHSFDPENAVAFICGPEIMMRYSVIALQDAGLPDSDIYISMERNMQCGIGQCGHCQLGPFFVCKDGPVFNYETVRPWLKVREL